MTDEIASSVRMVKHLIEEAERLDNERLRANSLKLLSQHNRQRLRHIVLSNICSNAELRQASCQQAQSH